MLSNPNQQHLQQVNQFLLAMNAALLVNVRLYIMREHASAPTSVYARRWGRIATVFGDLGICWGYSPGPYATLSTVTEQAETSCACVACTESVAGTGDMTGHPPTLTMKSSESGASSPFAAL